MPKFFLLLCCLMIISCNDHSIQITKGDSLSQQCVILLHGLGRTWRSMQPLVEALNSEGYTTVNIDYPSRKATIEKLAVQTVPKGITQCREHQATTIHFVTHSMGGILVRYYLSHHQLPTLGHVVMFSPPNHGSEIADLLKENELYYWLNGPAGLELGTGQDELPSQIGRATYSLGIITGNQSSFFDVFFASVIPGEDDGKVSVNSARLQGMADFLVVPESHPFIMSDETALDQTLFFLGNGRFQH